MCFFGKWNFVDHNFFVRTIYRVNMSLLSKFLSKVLDKDAAIEIQKVEYEQQQWVYMLFTIIIIILFMILRAFGVKERIQDVSTGLRRQQDLTRVNSSSNLLSAKIKNQEKVLSASMFRPFKLISIRDVNHNTKLLKFEIPNMRELSLPIGRHISVRVFLNGCDVLRPYTPTSRPDQKGFFELLVKKYDLGKMSPYLHDMVIGNYLDCRGPIGNFRYKANMYKNIALIAAGSGLTPCLQVIRCILENKKDDDITKLKFFYQNRSEIDVLLKDDIDKLAIMYPNQLEVFYYVTQQGKTDEWGKGLCTSNANIKEKKGYISNHDLKNISSQDKWLICGPTGFNKNIVETIKSIGYKEEQIHEF